MTRKAAAKAAAKGDIVSLADFATTRRRAARRAGCAVCALPDDIREQTKAARDKKIDMATILAWLSSLGHKISEATYAAHGAGHHDRQVD